MQKKEREEKKMAVQTTDFFSKICGEKINCHFSEFYVQGVHIYE